MTKTNERDLVPVVVSFFYGDAAPGDTVMVDAEEAHRLCDLGAKPGSDDARKAVADVAGAKAAAEAAQQDQG